MLSQARAVFELIFAGILWGFGFIAAAWTLDAAGPLSITAWRFSIAGLIGAIFFWRKFTGAFAQMFRAAAFPGLMIGLTLVLQTWGLIYTTATKSAFLTCLYVLLVPILHPLSDRFLRPRNSDQAVSKQLPIPWLPPARLLICGVGALLGVALMCGLLADRNSLGPKDAWNFGDGLTVLCALAASIHILAVGQMSDRIGKNFDSFTFNTYQSFWAGLPCLILALPFWGLEKGPLFPIAIFQSLKPLLGFTSLALGSTLIAFALQVRAQKSISPSLASILFLLESPFAAIFAFLFLNERLEVSQLAGGALIIAAIAASVLGEFKSEPAPPL